MNSFTQQDIGKTQSNVLMVIPTLGVRLDLLRETLDSIVNQAPVPPDLVIVCPAKSVEARKLGAEFGALWADDPRGLSAAVNVGFKMALPHHKYLTWMGDDDLLRPGSIATSVDALQTNSAAVLAYGYCDYIDDRGKNIVTSRAGRLAPWLMTWGPNLVPLPGLLLRRTSLEEVGGFDESLKYAMDLDVLLKLRIKGPFLNTRKTLAAFRWHSSSTTVANRSASLSEAELVKRRYLSRPLKALAPIWELPVRFATHLAAQRVSSIAKSKRKAEAIPGNF
jgi:GT2 family glycosyltransferase